LHRVTSPGRYRAITAFLLLTPGTPMLFQGQEFAASSPFLFFADHEPAAHAMVWEGRIRTLSEFPSQAQPEMRPYHANPADPGTFHRSKLSLAERQSHGEIYQLHKDLLRLRRDEPVFQAAKSIGLDGAVLADEAFVLRYFGEPLGRPGDDRLLIVNLGMDLKLGGPAEPLLAPPEDHLWQLQWSSEAPCYGGTGTPPVESELGWHIPGHAAVVMRPAQKTAWKI
jgi:maltooligosyltrehalose trehalohydrolase